ncbi:MAG: preprotein translocase subunit SecG [Candidatus Lindowbacteria bacterium]|nr:preprotein translocase subunit SecG [Candidatus Lindowbacteria bacterium]
MSWVGILLLIIHIIACTGLILIVLLQAGKGASLGASFGGGASQTVFGARSATFIGRLTWVLAGAFMATSLLLTVVSPRGNRGTSAGSSVLHEEPVALPPAGGAPQQAQPGTIPQTETTAGTAETTKQGEKTSAPAAPAKSPEQSKQQAPAPVKQKHP